MTGTKPLQVQLASGDPLAAMQAHVPDLEFHMLEGCGHWTQAERADEVETLLLPWLKKVNKD